MPKKLPIWDQRMLEVMKYCIDNKIRCTEQKEWCKIIGISPTGIAQIRNSKAGFQHTHIQKTCRIFNINIHWIYGISQVMFFEEKKVDPIKMIRAQLVRIQKEYVLK